MIRTIKCDRIAHNYLNVKLNGGPLTVGHPIGYWVDLLVQTPMYQLRMSMAGPSALSFHIPVELDVWNPRRNVNLMNDQECYMFCVHVEHFMMVELMEALDQSDNYNDTFFEFQEKYWLSDLDISRDKMYKWYERYKAGKVQQRYWVKAPEWV